MNFHTYCLYTQISVTEFKNCKFYMLFKKSDYFQIAIYKKYEF